MSENSQTALLNDEVETPPKSRSGDRIADIIPSRLAFACHIAPMEIRGNCLHVIASKEPSNDILDDLRLVSGFWIDVTLTSETTVLQTLRALYGVAGDTVREMLEQDVAISTAPLHETEEDEATLAQQASVIKLVNELLTDAIQQRASDLHIEPDEQELIVRVRVDGILRRQAVPPQLHRFRLAICSRLKILASLNIAEKRLPQDGGFRTTVSGREIDVRVSIIPMLHGEGVVLRLLESNSRVCGLDDLDFPLDELQRFRQLIRRPHGIVLVTGPTGSGKTTTLYSALAELQGPDLKVITVEDPVEYRLPGVSQIQVNPKIGLTFAAGLRGILRHDPDVILLGEIRDSETAQSAIHASLTGHLVLSTLHTNDACSAVTRLIDMGIEPYLVASTLEGVLAQRLVRRLCSHCRQQVESSILKLPSDYHVSPNELIWTAGECEACFRTGYSGRTAISELVVLDAELRSLAITRTDASQLRRAAAEAGMRTMRHNGWFKVRSGQTTIDEILRVVADSNT